MSIIQIDVRQKIWVTLFWKNFGCKVKKKALEN